MKNIMRSGFVHNMLTHESMFEYLPYKITYVYIISMYMLYNTFWDFISIVIKQYIKNTWKNLDLKTWQHVFN